MDGVKRLEFDLPGDGRCIPTGAGVVLVDHFHARSVT